LSRLKTKRDRYTLQARICPEIIMRGERSYEGGGFGKTRNFGSER